MHDGDAWAAEIECCICIRPIERERAAVLEPCGHAFHRECIVTWLRGGRHTCPLCRGRASVEDVMQPPNGVLALAGPPGGAVEEEVGIGEQDEEQAIEWNEIL